MSLLNTILLDPQKVDVASPETLENLHKVLVAKFRVRADRLTGRQKVAADVRRL